MFLRKSTRRYEDKVYTNYMLVESVHTAKGPRQKVVCSLGDLSPRPAKEWLVVSLIEGVELSCREVLYLLQQAMRQHSIGACRRIDYLLGFLHQHPP